MFDRIRSHAQMIEFDGAGHANLYKQDPSRYVEILRGATTRPTL